MNVTGEDMAREFYLEAHSLTSGAIEWRRQLSPKQGGCPRVQEDSLPFTTSSFVGNDHVVCNFWFQEDINTHCSGFVLLDSKVPLPYYFLHSTPPPIINQVYARVDGQHQVTANGRRRILVHGQYQGPPLHRPHRDQPVIHGQQ